MSEFLICAVYDKCAEKLLSPFFVENHDVAKRTFATNIKNIPIWNENPEQFELYDLGLITDKGNIIGKNIELDGNPIILHPELICKGTDL